MPSRITPLDVKAFAGTDIYQVGEQVYEKGLVRHRFQTNYGLQAVVKGKEKYRVEMIVDGEKLFGRCNCPSGSVRCEHQIALLLSWLYEPASFISYQDLRKAIRSQDKNNLVDVIMNLIEVFPELSQFFVTPVDLEESAAIREEVADIFDFPQSHKIKPQHIINSCQILFARAKLLRNTGRWRYSRTIYFEIINRILALVDRQQTAEPFRDNFIAELADDYEEIALNDPDLEAFIDEIKAEIKQLLNHESAETEGVSLETLKKKIKELS
jgi:uncharacterized Zn finger protein